MQQRRAQLVDVMRRDIRCHADRDAGRPVRKQIRECGRKHRRLLLAPVVVGAELDRILVDPIEQVGSDRRQTRFRVAVGCRVIAVDVAEVALPVDQRITHREILRQARQRIVDRLVAVRMVVTHRLADDLRALAIAAFGIEAELPHGIKNAPVDRLQPVAHVGQRPVHDGGERIGEIAFLERVLEVDGLDGSLAGGRNRLLGHGPWLLD